MSALKTEALPLRDAALAVIRRDGLPQMTFSKIPVRIIHAEISGLRIVHNAPSTSEPVQYAAIKRALDRAGQGSLPYVLNVWDGNAKVFLVAWDANDLKVTTFRRGSWIERLQDAAQRPS